MEVLLEITNSMEQTSSPEAKSRLAGQEIPHLLRNPKIHYRVHKRLSLVAILIQMNLGHILTSYFFKNHFNIILPPMPTSLK
jgi:aspartyl/asparaginyl-tRNA synthetase